VAPGTPRRPAGHAPAHARGLIVAAERFPPQLDPERSNIILIVGRKGSGKSVHARAIYDTYPYDKLVVDPSGDAQPGDDAEEIRPPFPKTLKPADNGKPRNIHARVDPRSDTYRDDMDRAVAMGLWPRDRPAMVWLDEVGEVMQANSTPPHVRLALMSSRHHGPMSLVMAGPRPMHISPLAISQADRLVIYDLPNPHDVDRLAENMGYPPAALRAAVVETRKRNAVERQNGADPFYHLVYDQAAQQMWRMPPVPARTHAGPKS
jgi:hypothetical protein